MPSQATTNVTSPEMDTSIPDSEPHGLAEAGKRASKINKACVPCRARKVKCDGAVVGLPCSSCKSRQCTKDCVPLIRKDRIRKTRPAASTPSPNRGRPATSNRQRSANHSRILPDSSDVDIRSPGQTEPDLLYLHILNDATQETPGSSQPHAASTAHHRSKVEETLTPRNCLTTTLSHLDEMDREYLAIKGVFELPPRQHLDTLIKLFFVHVYPTYPVINRADFISRYQSGDCSLLLLRAMLTTASCYASADLLSACGYDSRAAAQESLFSQARLTCDFGAESDPLLMLQASMILCSVILDRPADRDFGYWFHNAISLATKINLRDVIFGNTKPREVLKLYRRIWWTLCSLDVFHVFINTRRSLLLDNPSDIKPSPEDYREDNDVLEQSSGLLSPINPDRELSPVVVGELCQIFRKCLSIVKSQPQQDPRQLMHPLDSWHKSLASKMNCDGVAARDIYYLNIQALAYRFECILCRRIRRACQRSGQVEWCNWAKQRVRFAILELDTIAMRVLASETLEDFPMPFVTTITALLALHIESALDSTETHLIRSMSRISISQTMLLLTQGSEIPVLKRALPIFEDFLGKHNLYSTSPNNLRQSTGQVPPLEDTDEVNANSSQTQARELSPQFEEWDNTLSDMDFLDLDFLENWQQMGQLNLPT